MLLNAPRSTATQSPTRMPDWSETIRVVEPPMSTVYSNAWLWLARTSDLLSRECAADAAQHAVSIPTVRTLPQRPIVPPMMAPPVCAPRLASVTVFTAVMRPNVTFDCAQAARSSSPAPLRSP
jgi:hypothetical protein